MELSAVRQLFHRILVLTVTAYMYVAGYETSGYGCFTEIVRFRRPTPPLYGGHGLSDRLFPVDGGRALPPRDLSSVFLPQCPPCRWPSAPYLSTPILS